MKFGVDIPTCLAGMAYPIPFATANDVVWIAVEAEQLGYHEVAGNDHLSTQRFVRKAWAQASTQPLGLGAMNREGQQ